MAKTNAIRIIESLGIPYQTAEYEVSDEHQDAVTVAQQLGIASDIIFKTLVAHNECNEICVFCVPANAELNLKKAARAAGAKNIALISLKDLLPLTGYVRGGCSPIGMKKPYPVFIDETAVLLERMYVNAGTRGMQMVLAPVDLVKVCGAGLADIT
jgi:Cys-tRNA(Pro)/Cys-tRNA(Cys) deacylase